jgi:serine O-acetyltransferase
MKTRTELREYLQADLWYSGEQTGWHVRSRFVRRALYYQRVLRRAEYWDDRGKAVVYRSILMVYKWRLLRLGERIGMEIPRHTCGPGLSVAHPGTIVVNGDAQVGARCRLSQGVTIGAGMAGAPRIGSDVFVGPHSQIIGGVTVGDGATILPGAVVVSDVAARCTVGGVPARVTASETRPWHEAIMVVPIPGYANTVGQ